MSGIFFLTGLGLAAWDFLVPVEEDAFRFRLLGEIWYKADPGSLNLLQAVVERYIHPALWDPAFLWLLLRPAALIAGGLALVFLLPALLIRQRRRRRKLFQ
jgi:hypothetical protein